MPLPLVSMMTSICPLHSGVLVTLFACMFKGDCYILPNRMCGIRYLWVDVIYLLDQQKPTLVSDLVFQHVFFLL